VAEFKTNGDLQITSYSSGFIAKNATDLFVISGFTGKLILFADLKHRTCLAKIMGTHIRDNPTD
jgi:hypothetical protein